MIQDNPPRLHPDRLIVPAFLLGVMMILIGIVLAGVLRGDSLRQTWYPTQDTNVAQEILIGFGAGGLGIAAVWVLGELIAPLRDLREKLIAMLIFEKVTVWHALAFGLLAGIPEEMLFRGGLQPTLGLILTSVLFGVLHAISRTYMIYATCAGLYLGLLFAWRGDLWAATTAHAAYDAGLFLIMAWQVKSGVGTECDPLS